MKITTLTERTKLSFAKALVANELGNQMSLVYKFSDADGVRTGKSGWSFGIAQLDINNNAFALLALREMGFTMDEVAGLRAQTVTDMAKMDAKLLSHKDVVDRWDRKQIAECLTWPLSLCADVDFSGEEAFVHVADYHNQFGMSKGGKMHSWLLGLNGACTPEMVRDFKLALPWGVKRPDDVQRRYNNIVRIMREEAA